MKRLFLILCKTYKELYNRTNDKFKDKARKDCLWEIFARSFNLSVKVCKTWFKSQKPRFGKLIQSMSDQAPKDMAGRQHWTEVNFNQGKTRGKEPL